LRILTTSFLIAILFMAILNFFDIEIWIKAAYNLVSFIKILGVKYSLLNEALFVVWETFVMAIFGVSLGTIFAYLLAPVATPIITATIVSMPLRIIANMVRAIPAIFWAILFVILLGPGPRAGALALAVYTSGYLIKFFYESLESSDKDLVDTLKVMGLKRFTLAFAVYASVKKQIISHIFFMLEYNVRSAAIIGFVGAGGVGYYILQYISLLDYQATVTYILVTMALVISIDVLSYLVRSRI